MSTHSINSGQAPKLFDVHTHVQFHAFNDDADIVIQRSLAQGVWMVNVGTQKNTSEDAIKFAERYSEGVYATVGLHPIHTEKSHHDPQELGLPAGALAKEGGERGFTSQGEEFDYEFYKKAALHSKVVAIGECGLDYYRLTSDTKAAQKKTFLQQIELAHEVKKPLMIHCRNAFADIIRILKTQSHKLKAGYPGVIHFFSGTKDDAKELLGLGFSFSFGGVITFARNYDEAIRYIPLERILLETDAPYVAPMPHRGKRNEPAYVIEVAKKLALLKGVSPGEAERQTTQNALKIFKI